MTSELAARLQALRSAGWSLRTCYTLRQPDVREGGWQSYHADELEQVVKRVEQTVKSTKEEA